MTLPQYEQSDRIDGNPAATHPEPIRPEPGAVTSVDGIQYAPEAETPQMVKGHPSISRAFERMNEPRMRRDRLPEWFRAAVLSIAIGAVVVGLAHHHRMNALAANWEQINEF